MDSVVQINIISTNNDIGEKRRQTLLPKVKDLNYKLYINNLKKDTYPTVDLWNKVKNIIKENIHSDYVVIMEDDCIFKTEDIEKDLEKIINYCINTNINLIFTGCSKVANPIKVEGQNLITMSAAHNSQLVVIFKPLYNTILEYPSYGLWDVVLSSMSQLKNTRVGLTLPFLTGQLKTGLSNLNSNKQEEIGERFEIEEQRLLKIFKNEK